MIYKVPLQADNYVEGNGYFYYKGSELYIDTVQCSNKLVAISFTSLRAVYIDLENGNIVSAYRPGGNAFLLGNVIEFYRSCNYELSLSNMVYWIESFCMGEFPFTELGGLMAENPVVDTYFSTALLLNSQDMNWRFLTYYNLCSSFTYILQDVFSGRRSRLKELMMVSGGSSCYNYPMIRVLSYLRARNKDFETLYCRERDSFYINIANKYSIGKFLNKDEIVKCLRSIHYTKNSDMAKVLRNSDESITAELHDFALDLEKIKQVWQKI